MKNVSSHCGDITGYFDKVSEQRWHNQLCCRLLGREDGTKMMAELPASSALPSE